jgi:hypothetical protein
MAFTDVDSHPDMAHARHGQVVDQAEADGTFPESGKLRSHLVVILSAELRAGTAVEDLRWALRRCRDLKLSPQAIPGLVRSLLYPR